MVVRCCISREGKIMWEGGEGEEGGEGGEGKDNEFVVSLV